MSKIRQLARILSWINRARVVYEILEFLFGRKEANHILESKLRLTQAAERLLDEVLYSGSAPNHDNLEKSIMAGRLLEAAQDFSLARKQYSLAYQMADTIRMLAPNFSDEYKYLTQIMQELAVKAA